MSRPEPVHLASAPAAVPPPYPVVALLPWGNVIEDFLDDLGVSLQEFCAEMTGGWLFGYVQALHSAGIAAIIVCVSRDAERVTTMMHTPTGAPILVLPTSRTHRAVRARLDDAYGWKGGRARGVVGKYRWLRSAVLRDLGFYSATPPHALAAVLRRHHCSAIVCQEYEYARFDVCVAVGRLLRIPVFATFQGGDWRMGQLERAVRPLSVRASAGLIVPTGTEAERVVRRYGVPRERVARIFNPLDLSQWAPTDRATARDVLGIPQHSRLVVWHGRIDIQRKGLDVLLDAWAEVTAGSPGADVHLVLIGTGADAPALRQRLAERPLPRLTWRDEYLLDRHLVRCYLSAADIYVFPSRHEGFPVAPLEAMACAVPVVAAAAPGIADIFEAGEAHGGLVVERANPHAIARAIRDLLGDESRARRLGESARARVAAVFSVPAVGEQLRAFLTRSGMMARSEAAARHAHSRPTANA